MDDLFNIKNSYFEGMVNQIYPPELQLNKAYTSDTEAPVLNFHLSISNGLVSSKIYNKHDKFPFLDGDVPCQPFYGVYIFQLKRFARVCSHVEDFLLLIDAYLLNFSNRVIGIIGLERLFPSSIAATMNKFLLHKGLSGPEYYGDLVYKFKEITIGRTNFSDQFRKKYVTHVLVMI